MLYLHFFNIASDYCFYGLKAINVLSFFLSSFIFFYYIIDSHIHLRFFLSISKLLNPVSAASCLAFVVEWNRLKITTYNNNNSEYKKCKYKKNGFGIPFSIISGTIIVRIWMCVIHLHLGIWNIAVSVSI